MDDDGEAIWTRLAPAMLGLLPGSTCGQILSAGPLLPLAGPDDLAYSLSLFVDTLPEWGAGYRSSDRRVIDAYGSVLLQIDPILADPGSTFLRQQYARQQPLMQAAAEAAAEFKLAKAMSWWEQRQEYLQRGRIGEAPSWQQYFAPLAPQWAVLTAEAAKQAAIGLALVDARRVPAFVSAVGAWQAELAADRPVPAYAFTPEPWRCLDGWRQGRGLSPARLDLGAIAGLGTVIASFVTQTSITAQPAGWLRLEVLRQYENGPWLAGTPLATGASCAYGPTGVFALLPACVVVAQGLAIDLTVEPGLAGERIGELRARCAQGIQIGPFLVSGDWDGVQASVALTGQTPTPRILALASEWLPAGRPPSPTREAVA